MLREISQKRSIFRRRLRVRFRQLEKPRNQKERWQAAYSGSTTLIGSFFQLKRW